MIVLAVCSFQPIIADVYHRTVIERFRLMIGIQAQNCLNIAAPCTKTSIVRQEIFRKVNSPVIFGQIPGKDFIDLTHVLRKLAFDR